MWLWTACSTRRLPANMPAKSVSLQGWSLDIWIQPHCHQSVNCRCRKLRNYKKHSSMRREEWRQQATMKHPPWGTVILKQLTMKYGTAAMSVLSYHHCLTWSLSDDNSTHDNFRWFFLHVTSRWTGIKVWARTRTLNKLWRAQVELLI